LRIDRPNRQGKNKQVTSFKNNRKFPAQLDYMQKLYKYRPLSEFLFKELKYQELYFASYQELNDPFDLNVRIDFTPEKSQYISQLIHLLFKSTLILKRDKYSKKESTNNGRLITFIRDKEICKAFEDLIFGHLQQLKSSDDFIFFEGLEIAIIKSIADLKLKFKFDLEKFKSEILRITSKFLNNSYTSCFSEDPANFLMWSHYASKHAGVCLEFTLNRDGLFPYEMEGRRQYKDGNGGCGAGQTDFIQYDENVLPVIYKDIQPCLNFFDFAAVFANENDADLIGLSKSRWHGYARHLESLFATKTAAWNYEREWRAIEINFDKPKEPEERIRHYPIEALTGIYFGTRTPEAVKNRIYNLYKNKLHTIKLIDCKLSDGKELNFQEWELPEEE
jgi:hypothetical protein